MRSDQFTKIVNETPWYVAVFEIKTLPDWLKNTHNPEEMQVGTRVYWAGGGFSTLKGALYNVGHSYVKFLGYARAKKVGPYTQIKLLEEPQK